MASTKNYYYYNDNIETLNRLAEEYIYIGRNATVEVDNRRLVVLALEPRKPKPKRAPRPARREDDE